MCYLHQNVICIHGSKCRTVVNIILYQFTLLKIPKMPHTPNSSQGPFPKIAGKGPDGIIHQNEKGHTKLQSALAQLVEH